MMAVTRWDEVQLARVPESRWPVGAILRLDGVLRRAVPTVPMQAFGNVGHQNGISSSSSCAAWHDCFIVGPRQIVFHVGEAAIAGRCGSPRF
jgi:hypothetical protein